MFATLRQLERWLHQHIFKVGWLVTKSFQTTTILYYTFFLPGVFLYEFVYWLVAGIFDVRAERAIAWPEVQEIGELRLSFIQLSRRASAWKVAVISLSPLIAGIVVVWFIANNVLDIGAALRMMRTGRLSDIAAGIEQVTSTPDFWLWAYLLIAVSNTMMPDFAVLKGWWKWIVAALILAALPFFWLGLEDQVVGAAVTGPLADALNILSSIFAVIIVFDLLGVAVLGTVEAIIERITGDSATFKNGKMIVMSREEAIAEREKERERARARQRRRERAAAAQGPPSIYNIALPTPGAPGDEPVTQRPSTLIEPEEAPALSEGQRRPRREEPDVVTSTADRPEPSKRPTPPIHTYSDDSDDQEQEQELDRVERAGRTPESRTRSLPARGESHEVRDASEEDEVPRRSRFGQPSSGLRPGPFSERDDSDENDQDDEDSRDRSSSGLRPRPFSVRASSDSEETKGEDANEEEDDTSTRRSSFGSPSHRLRPRPFSGSRASDEDEDEEEDVDNGEGDELTYEDIEDPA